MSPHDLTIRHWRIVFVLWLLLLTVATHFPQAAPSGNPVFETPDKMLHFICFGLLGFIFMCARWFRTPFICFVTIALWALIDEITQDLLPLNRPFSYADLIAGDLGIMSFLFWSGALSKDSTIKIRESVERTLSTTKNWFTILFISFVVGVVSMVLFWFSFKTILGKQYSSASFFVSILVTTGCVLWFFVANGGLQETAARLIKSMLQAVLVTIVIAAMIGITVSYTQLDPWVAVLAAVVVCLRFVWNRAT